VRHEDIEDDDVVVLSVDEVQRFDAVARAVDVRGVVFSEVFDEELADDIVILHDQDVSSAHVEGRGSRKNASGGGRRKGSKAQRLKGAKAQRCAALSL
jgi:hypothetical protein